MKPQEESDPQGDGENQPTVSGDVIGDTAYSERFVLKILLKLANLDTLKDEINEKPFEDDLCTLWDMTAERDVVFFLQKHDVLSLINFALPVIESPRIIEILIGIIGNMCCQKEVVEDLLNKNSFLTCLLEYVKSDDALILVQVLRLISSSLYVAEDADITVWMSLFQKVEYSPILYFILQNSTNKELLVTALENLNTLCSYCNTEISRLSFFTHFVTIDALQSLSAAFTEVTTNQTDHFGKEEMERILVISLQIIINLVGFNKSQEIYNGSKDNVINIISFVLTYYKNKLVNQKEIDTDLIDIIDCTNTIITTLNLSECSGPEKYFQQSFNMWKALKSLNRITKPDQNGSNFEEDDKEELQEFSQKMQYPLCTLICLYLDKCPEVILTPVLEEIGSKFDEIISSVRDPVLVYSVSNRTANYRIR